MNIVGRRKIFYSFSGFLFAAAVAALALWGLKFGIDFSGGSIIELEFAVERPASGDLMQRLKPLNAGDIRIQATGERSILIRTLHLDEPAHERLLGLIRAGRAPEDVIEKRFDSVGPSIGQELRRRSAFAILLVILLIVSYIAWAFRKVSAPVESWKYGVTTVIALVHDVIIPVGFFAVAGRFFGFEVDTLFVTAVLTILGFSVHDTIVVFDRIREHLKRDVRSFDFEALVNRSVSETIVRSINTSLTVVLALAAVYIAGGQSTRIFSLTLIIGIIAGTYSSIFIASPLLVTWHKLYQRG